MVSRATTFPLSMVTTFTANGAPPGTTHTTGSDIFSVRVGVPAAGIMRSAVRAASLIPELVGWLAGPSTGCQQPVHGIHRESIDTF